MPPGKRRRKVVDRKAIAKFLVDLDHDLQIVESTRSQLVRDVCRHDEDLMITAIHEAGHCVAAWAAGFPIVEMDLREEYSPYREEHPPTTTWQVHEQRLARHFLGTVLVMAVTSLAGFMAEKRLARSHDEISQWGDFEQARNDLRLLGPLVQREADFDAVFNEVMKKADEILDEHWNKVETLALAALKFGPVLEGAAVEQTIALA